MTLLSQAFLAAGRAELERLRAQRDEINRQMAVIDQLLAGASVPAATREITVSESPRPRRKPGRPGTIRPAIAAVLTEAGGPLHYRDIYERVTARGVVFHAKRPIESLGASLSLYPEFRGLGAGMWTLVDSEPAAPSGARTPALTAPVNPLPEHTSVDSPIRQRFMEDRERVRREQEAAS